MPLPKDAVTGDPLVGAHFALELGGKVKGYFTECSGLGSESEIVEHKVVEANGETVIYKIAGRLKWGDIVLKRGITSAMDMWDWRKLVETGKLNEARINGSIMMFTQTLELAARWDFDKGWPSKISGPSIKADSNEIGIEELTIAHEGIRRVS
jgi:phage tail-like protein